MTPKEPFVFNNGDAPYLRWMKENPRGFVLNTTQGLKTRYLVLHRTGCYHISGYTSLQSEGAFTLNGYIKVCSNAPGTIIDWISKNRPPGAKFRPCGTCRPAISDDAFLLAEQVSADETYPEGATCQIVVNAYERNPQARAKCLLHYGPTCSVCEMTFKHTYGSKFEGFIHVHHLRPLNLIRRTYQVDPIKDLRPVCPNCHAIIHFGGKTLTIEEARRLLKTTR